MDQPRTFTNPPSELSRSSRPSTRRGERHHWLTLGLILGTLLSLTPGMLAAKPKKVHEHRTVATPPPSPAGPMVETVIPTEKGRVVIRSRVQGSQRGVFHAEGDVVLLYDDMEMHADTVDYDSNTGQAQGSGHVLFRRAEGELTCERFEFDVKNKTGKFTGVRGEADKLVHFQADEVAKIGPDTYTFSGGSLTTCENPDHPHWSFTSSHATVVKDKTATMTGSVVRLFGVPVFYMPWAKFPIKKEERQSGFLIPSTGSSTQKGRRFSESFYLTLGRSADLLLTGTWFSKRGTLYGTDFRSRLSEESYFNLSTLTVRDRQHQGGSSVVADGFFAVGRGFRAAVSINDVSSIVFRQVYEDSYTGAIRPDELVNGYMYRCWDSATFGVSFDSHQYYLGSTKVTSRTLPEASFWVNHPLSSRFPAYVTFQATGGLYQKEVDWEEQSSAGPVARRFDTPGLTERFDLSGQILVPIPAGPFRLSITPEYRYTYWGRRLDLENLRPGGIPGTQEKSVTRGVASLEADLAAPRLHRTFRLLGSTFRHVVEADVKLRMVDTSGALDQVIRFDTLDTFAPTRELEYSLVNRIIGKRNGLPWEWASLTLRQKQFLDPDFGGVFRPGQENAIAPLTSFSPYATTFERRHFSPLQAVLRINPAPSVSGQFRVEYDKKHEKLRDWSAMGTLGKELLWVSVAYLRVNQIPGASVHGDYLQTSVSAGHPDRGLSADFNIAYNVETHRRDSSYARLNYFWDCLGISVEYTTFNLGKPRKESDLRISLIFRHLGQVGTLRNLGRRYF